MLVYLIVLSLTTVSQNYAAVIVKQESLVRRVRDETQPNKYPFLAYVNIGNDSCAGAVLSDSWVVTARACGNTTAQESGWVYAGDANIQKRRVAEQHSCPENHRLLLLHLEEPLAFDEDVSAVPIVRPGTFSGHEGTCDVITFGAEPSETNLKTAHAVETTLVAGSECTGSAGDGSALVPRNALGAPSSDAPYNGTIDNAAITVATNQTRSSDETNPSKISGDSGKTKKRDILGLETIPTEITDANLLCSSEINEEAASLKQLGSPVICKGVLIALVTPKPFNDASREKKEDPKTYYTAIGPDYSWILQKVPGVQVVSWNEVAKEGRSVRSKTAGSFPAESRVHKMRLHNTRRRRLSHLANMIAAVTPDKDGSEDPKLELDDELEPHLRLNKIFSLWFPMASRVRGIILLNRMLVRPQNELWGDLSEKAAEAALRPLRRVKRSSLEEDAERSTADAKASPPLLQPWNFRRTKREDKSMRQLQCDDASVDRSKRSTSGDTAESVPCITESRAQYGTTRLAQRLAVRDKTSRTPHWKDRQGPQAPTA